MLQVINVTNAVLNEQGYAQSYGTRNTFVTCYNASEPHQEGPTRGKISGVDWSVHRDQADSV